MRMRNKPWAEDYIKEHHDIVALSPNSCKGNWSNVFQNRKPVHLEVGTGKGQFIANMAKQHPEINFVGLELAKSVIVRAIDKVKEKEVTNVRLINGNAENLLEFFAENELDTIYLNFSDPWPKSRHEKRRLTYHTFLERYKKILKPDGKLILKTDNQGFFEYSLVSFSKFGIILDEVTLNLHAIGDPLNVMTEYEEKFSKKGQPIYRCIAHFNK
jgi:tRNA (guanine-N7-)-methyltransferase